MVAGSNPITVTYTLDVAPVLSRDFLNIQATIECRFTLKHVSDMIITTVNLKPFCIVLTESMIFLYIVKIP